MRHAHAAVALMMFAAVPVTVEAEDVVWTGAVGVSVTGNSLTKTGSTAWNAGAASVAVIRDGYGYVEATATETNTERMIGLSRGDTNQDYPDIDFAVYLSNAGLVAVYEAGNHVASLGAYVSGDRFRVEAFHGTIRYRKNGTTLYTSPKPPAYPLRVDSSLKTTGATLTDVKVGNLVWQGEVGVSASNGTLTKTAGTAWGNGGAASANMIPAGDGYVEFVAGQNTTSRLAGLGVGDSGQSQADVDFGIHLRADGIVTVLESGTSRGDFGGYVGSDLFRVAVSGGVVRYFKNEALFYTSAVTPAYPLRLDTAFETTGSLIQDVRLERVGWTGDVGVSTIGGSLVKSGAAGWNAYAATEDTLASGDGFLEFTAIETNTTRALGLESGTSVALADLDFAIALTAAGAVEVWESGAQRSIGSVTYAHGDRLRIEVREGVVRYRQNGQVLYTSAVAPTYPLHGDAALYTTGATVMDVAFGDLVWTGETGMLARGALLTKTTAATAWDAGAVSTRAINSGWVEFTATGTDGSQAYRMVGLSHGDMNVGYQDIDYAIYLVLSGGSTSVQVYEKGNPAGTFGSYAAGDRFRVEVTASQVKYSKNGAAPFRTVSLTSPLPLRVDTAFHHQNAAVLDLVLSGAATTDELEPPVLTPGTATYNTPQSVTMTAYPGATIRYTLDGSEPTTGSAVYSGPVTVDTSRVVKAKAWKTGFTTSATTTETYTFVVAAPGLTPGAATYTTPQTLTASSTSPGVTLRYTTNGVDPTEASPVFPAGLLVDVTTTVKVKGWRTGWTPSSVTTGVYTLKVATPVLNPAGGSFSGPTNVTVSSTSPGVTLRYSLTGAEPTTSDPTVASGAQVTVSSSTSLKVAGWRTGWATSDTGGASFLITNGTVAAPTMTPPPNTYTAAQSVTLSSTTTGATIRFTTDGTDPGMASAVYAGPISVPVTTTLKAKAFKADWTASSITTGAYTIDTGAVQSPTLSPGTGTYPTFQQVTVVCGTAGATIRYTLDGREPTATDPVVTSGGTVLIDRSLRLRAKAWKTGLTPSPLRNADYRITGALSGGDNHSLAVKADGSVWGWGENFWGQLGDTTNTSPRLLPVQVRDNQGTPQPLADAVAVAAGTSHSLALRRDGAVWGWGRAQGSGFASDSNRAALIPGLTNVVALAAGNGSSLALKKDGTLWIWGNFNGVAYGSTPTLVSTLSGISAIATGRSGHALAVKTDGTASGPIWAWGANLNGSLGDGTTTLRTNPVRVVGLPNATGVAAGWFQSLGRTADNRVYAWGLNLSGEVGDGTTTTPRITPQAVLTVPELVPSALGAGTHSLFGDAAGVAYATGYNGYGQIGHGSWSPPYAYESTPQLVQLDRLVLVVAGRDHNLVSRYDGSAWAWGRNSTGQLGNNSTTGVNAPIAVLRQVGPPLPFVLVDQSWLLADSDGDTLSNDLEISIGSDPLDVDTNQDGIRDGSAYAAGLSVTDLDMDDDGLTNLAERGLRTDPFRQDTDEDTHGDATDCFPLDATRWVCPPPVPGDTTPPVITLTEPTNATLISSVP
jgi:alpha-tubulin suppressor-like RCC1 family protein